MTLLRQLRKTQGITTRQACTEVNCADGVLSSIELRKRTAWPRLQKALAALVGFKPEEIFEESGLARPSY